MKRREKADRIGRVLDELYPEPPIPLEHEDPFSLLVAVVLSAQTTDKKVNEITPALFGRAPTPEAMAALEVGEIHALIRQLGLAPQKARALSGLSRALLAEHGGRVPDRLEALVELPGVGRKTALVVLSQAFGQPAFPVDTHILRLAGRWGLSRAKTPEGVERDLCAVFPRERWSRTHLQIIYFGREHCPALRHEAARCPICAWASAKGSRRPAGAARSRRAAPGRARAR